MTPASLIEPEEPTREQIWPFIIAAAAGCISGRISEWPQLKPAIKWAKKEIERLESEKEALQKRVQELEAGTFKQNWTDVSEQSRRLGEQEERIKALEAENARLRQSPIELIDYSQDKRIAELECEKAELELARERLKIYDDASVSSSVEYPCKSHSEFRQGCHRCIYAKAVKADELEARLAEAVRALKEIHKEGQSPHGPSMEASIALTFLRSPANQSIAVQDGNVKGGKSYALDNIRLLAAREFHKTKSEAWGHIIRFCKDAGFEGSILREDENETRA